LFQCELFGGVRYLSVLPRSPLGLRCGHLGSACAISATRAYISGVTRVFKISVAVMGPSVAQQPLHPYPAYLGKCAWYL